MNTIRVWFARIVLAYAALLFVFLAQIYLLHPETGIARFGVTLDGSPHSITFLRTSLGAMFSAMAITAAYGLVRPKYLRVALIYLVVTNGCVVAARLIGFWQDGVTPTQLSELRNEGLSWLLFVAALWSAVRVRPTPP